MSSRSRNGRGRNGNAEQRAERRRRVLTLLDEGLAVREVARRLNIAASTVVRDRDAERPKVPDGLRSWPPAEPGNSRAVTHGLDSPRTLGQLEQRARELAPQLIDAHGHLDEARDGLAVLRYAMDTDGNHVCQVGGCRGTDGRGDRGPRR